MRAQLRSLARSAALAVLAACATSAKEAPPGPPGITLAITSPTAGAELVGSEAAAIKVTGTVAATGPTLGALQAWVNGTQVDVVDGGFAATVTPEAGINHIKVEAGDGLSETVAQELDVMWAPEYLSPAAGQTGFDLAGALELRLGQRFFDARLLGTALDRSTDPIVARDLASALELILWNINLASLVTGGIHLGSGGTTLDITIPSATPANILVDARIVDAPQPGPGPAPGPGIELKVDLLGVFLAMNGTFTFGGRVVTIAGGITADLHATARLGLGKAADGSIAVTVSGVTAALGPLAPGFTGPDGEELDALITLGQSDFRTLIEGLLSTQLIPTFTNQVPPLLEALLGAADKLLDNVSFTLDPGLGRPVTLSLDGTMGALQVAPGVTSGNITVREDLAVRTAGAALHPTSRGAARLDPSTAAPELDTSGLHLTMRQDFLNALLHSLWNAGLLEGQLTSGLLSANVSARLPPVIRATPASSPCKIDGERCDVLLELGQVELQLPDFGQSFALGASAGARIVINGGAVSLAIQQVPDVRVWETSETPGMLTPAAVQQLIKTLQGASS